MSKFTALTPDLYEYLANHRSDRDPLLAELAEETRQLGPISMMQVAPDQGALLTLLVRLTGARRALGSSRAADAARRLYEAAGFTRLCGPEGATGHFGCDAWYARELTGA